MGSVKISDNNINKQKPPQASSPMLNARLLFTPAVRQWATCGTGSHAACLQQRSCCCYLWLRWSLQGRVHRLGVAIGKRFWPGRHGWLQSSACLLSLGLRGAVVSLSKSIFHLHQRIRRHGSRLVGKERDEERVRAKQLRENVFYSALRREAASCTVVVLSRNETW